MCCTGVFCVAIYELDRSSGCSESFFLYLPACSASLGPPARWRCASSPYFYCSIRETVIAHHPPWCWMCELSHTALLHHCAAIYNKKGAYWWWYWWHEKWLISKPIIGLILHVNIKCVHVCDSSVAEIQHFCTMTTSEVCLTITSSESGLTIS